MWPWKSKPRALSLPANEARVTAQSQQNRVRFEREQYILQMILNRAKNGIFELVATDTSWYKAHEHNHYPPLLLNDVDKDFLKNLGYKIEMIEKTNNLPEYSTPIYHSANAIRPYSTQTGIKTVEYNEYKIKW